MGAVLSALGRAGEKVYRIWNIAKRKPGTGEAGKNSVQAFGM